MYYGTALFTLTLPNFIYLEAKSLSLKHQMNETDILSQ